MSLDTTVPFSHVIEIEALSTHPGFLLIKFLDQKTNALVAQSIMSVGMAKQVMSQLHDNTEIATKLLNNLQNLISQEALAGKFGDGMKSWATNSGYNTNGDSNV